VDNKPKFNTVKLTVVRKWIYTIILLLFPFIILYLVEILLRIAGYGYNFDLFINFPDKEFQEYRICNPEIGKKYFQINEPSSPPHDMFLKKKPENGFRIFVMGSSTVAAFPYYENLLFSRILQERLQDMYPQKYIEVVNTAITATNSFTFLDYMDEILKEKPDAILFYEGHNEFYGALGIGSNEQISKYRNLIFLHLSLLQLRLYQLIRNCIFGIGKLLAGNTTFPDKKGTLMKRIAENKDIGYKGEVYHAGIKQFRDNMESLIKKARKKKCTCIYK